jgi:D-xylose transport system ATP-binding protein
MTTATQVGAEQSASTSARPLLQLSGVSKHFGPVQALTDVKFEVAPAEVVALVGDNGAGKSTLIKTVSGVGPADTGTFTFDGQTVSINAPTDSASLGIAVVYQDLALCDNLDVVENLFLGREEAAGFPLAPMDEIAMEKRANELLEWMQIKTLRSVRSEVGALSGGQRQSIAIARSLLGEPRMVILDEPTAALGVSQTAQVLELIRNLKERGLGVILISHNLSDVFQVADRVVVLHLGRNAGEFPATTEHQNDIVAAITGVKDDGESAS